MLKVNPEEWASLKDIVEGCEQNVKTVWIDPYLIMDDIIEKLKLVNYES